MTYNIKYTRFLKKRRLSLRLRQVNHNKIKSITKGSFVEIISGKFKGEKGEVYQINNKKSLVIIKDLNPKTRTKIFNGQKVVFVQFQGVHVSNVLNYDKNTQSSYRFEQFKKILKCNNDNNNKDFSDSDN